nr:uncharacterized protein CI109_000944 [Kwoniella shandongensis]KAA5530764.1 hypothetical protein CI109_000944 [Kwoniella shandongensis]
MNEGEEQLEGGLDWTELWDDIIQLQTPTSFNLLEPFEGFSPQTPRRSLMECGSLPLDRSSLDERPSSLIDDQITKSPAYSEIASTYHDSASPPPLEFDLSQSSQDSFHLRTPTSTRRTQYNDRTSPPGTPEHAGHVVSISKKRKWEVKEEVSECARGLIKEDLEEEYHMESPFSRLSLCTPRRRPATPTPMSTPKPTTTPIHTHISHSASAAQDTTMTIPRQASDDLSSATHTRPSFLDIPQPPVFLLDPPHLLEREVKQEPYLRDDLSNPFIVPNTTNLGITQQNIDAQPPSQSIKINWIAHISTDGGLVWSMHRLSRMCKLNDDLGGVSMFINHPKRRVKDVRSDTDGRWECQRVFRNLGEDFRQQSMAHAVHTTNLLSSDPVIRARSKQSIIAEMKWARELGIPTLVIHLGSGEDLQDIRDRNRAMGRLILDLKEITSAVPQVSLGLENTVHPSPHSLTNLSSLTTLINHFPSPQLKICLDLCHLHVSEFDLNAESGREALFEILAKIGKERLVGIHVSDSMVKHGGKGDRHANIGYGYIDLNSFRLMLRHPLLRSVPTLLETPRHFKNLRYTSSPHSRKLAYHESVRSALERSFLQHLVNIPDEEWEEGDHARAMRGEYIREKKRVERQIYKVARRRGGATWRNFKEGRKKHL